MTSKINIILDNLKNLTLVESVELISQIENIFHITATSFASSSISLNSEKNSINEQNEMIVEQEEKTSFTVILTEVPNDKKIAVLKIVRNITGLGLKESKEIVDNTPKTIKENITKEESETIKKEFEALGAKIILQ